MFWKYLAVVVGSLVAMTAPIAVAGLAVTLLKRRNERADRDAATVRTR